MRNLSRSFSKSRLSLAAVLVLVAIVSFYPPGWDWIGSFRPACLAMLSGQSPYAVASFYNPPWVLLPLIPIALLPERIGVVLLSMAYLGSFIFVARRLGAKPLTTLLLITFPNFVFGLSFANIDWMVAWGLILPPQVGLFLVLAKPQIGIGLAIFWLVEAWRQEKFKTVARVFAPVTVAFVISIVLYGLWPLRPQHFAANSSLWPMSIPMGLVLLIAAVRYRRKGLAIVASPFLSPYVGVQSWSVTILGLLPYQVETITAIAGLWVVQIMVNEQLRMWLLGLVR